MFLEIEILPSTTSLKDPCSASLYSSASNGIGLITSVPSPTPDVRIPTSFTIKSPEDITPLLLVSNFL